MKLSPAKAGLFIANYITISYNSTTLCYKVIIMNINEFRECLTLQKDGSALTIGDATFYIRRANTTEYTKAFVDIKKALFKPWYQEHELTDDQILEATGHLLAEYLVAGWENVQDEDGNDVPFNESNASKIFTNQEYWQSLNLAIISHATNYSNYLHSKKKEDIEEAKKQ